MRLVRGLAGLKPGQRGCVATIGNYDGVHLGHRAVLRELAVRAGALDLPATVVVFEPTPQEFFAPASPPARLTTFREKWQALSGCGMDRVLCLRFDRRLADMPPEAFIERILVQGLGVRHLAVGDDFRFGRQRAGGFALLRDAGRRAGFEVADTPPLLVAGERVSSTRIRECLAAGDMRQAAGLLGRPYAMSGHVVPGERLGRTLGFPTANIFPRQPVLPVRGIFAAAVQGIGTSARYGAAYVGSRPAVGGRRPVLEVFVLDFAGELYGRRLRVEFLQRLREDAGFASLDELKQQIGRDVDAVRSWLRQQGLN